MKKVAKTPLAVTLGTSLITGLGAANAQTGAASDNPFALRELSSGYMVTAEAQQQPAAPAAEAPAQSDMKNMDTTNMDLKKMEGACGEGKCGAAMMKKAEEAKKSGGAAEKAMEGKCAGMK